jgi:hypothetical protein
LQAVDPWLSSKDIDRGSLWFTEITNQLSNTHNGIVCLTKSNLNKPWILFESGALAKGLSSNRVYTLLIDLKPEEVRDPLAQFNHTKPQKESVYQLVRTINRGLEKNSIKESILSNVFDTYWPQFEKKFADILKNSPEEDVKEKIPKDDLLKEILYSVRGIDKRLRRVEYKEETNYSRNSSFSLKDNPSIINIPIVELDLSIRAIKALKKVGINTFGDIMSLDFTEIQKFETKIENEIHELVSKAMRS